ISVSIGIAIYSGQESNYSDLFKKADIAMYKAKASSAKRYCIYD
ncbi:MAG: diguanylate cyclase, partial [Treponema sp.]|nr:diguanylate cyclase [Treponema sp.]